MERESVCLTETHRERHVSVPRAILTSMGIVFGKIDVECAAHDVLQVSGAGFAVRRYHPHVIARVRRGDGVKDNAAFNLLATYIGVYGTPKNQGRRPIAMTAPVISYTPERIDMTAPVV